MKIVKILATLALVCLLMAPAFSARNENAPNGPAGDCDGNGPNGPAGDCDGNGPNGPAGDCDGNGPNGPAGDGTD